MTSFHIKKLLSENMCFTLKEKNKTMSFHAWVKTIASHLVWPFCMLLFLLCFFLFMLLARLWSKFFLSQTSQECKKKKKTQSTPLHMNYMLNLKNITLTL